MYLLISISSVLKLRDVSQSFYLSHRVTSRLRFYPKDYVQEFMAESVSFILRNAPLMQLEKGNSTFYTLFPFCDSSL